MKAAVLHSANNFKLSEVATPKAGENEIVIRVKAAAFCGTDGRIITGKKTKGVRYPSIIGHEFSGIITDVGAQVKNFHLGERIAVDPVIPCRSCIYCRNGKENVCENRQAIGYEFDGAFAEYLRIPAIAIESGNVFKVPEHISYAAAALAEPLACCINGQKNIGITPGDSVVILGAGPIGLMHIMLARFSGAAKIIVSELNETRRKAASECGADIVIDSSSGDLKQQVLAATEGVGANVVIMAIGIPQLVNTALDLACKGGKVNLFAGFSKDDLASIDVNLIHYNELIITGASALTREGYRIALALISSGQLQIEKLISHRFQLADIDQALECTNKGDAIKVVIVNE